MDQDNVKLLLLQLKHLVLIMTQLPNKIGDQKKNELLKLLEDFIETKPEVITPNPETQVIEDVIEVPVIERTGTRNSTNNH